MQGGTGFPITGAFGMDEILLTEQDCESLVGIPKDQILEILQDHSVLPGNGTQVNAILDDWKETRTISALNFERVQSRLYKVQMEQGKIQYEKVKRELSDQHGI